MGIDGHPFPGVHMVEFQLAKGRTKVLSSAQFKGNGSVDPKVQISTNEFKKDDQQKSRYEQGETSRAGAMRPRVTSRILLNKWQYQKKKDYQCRLEEEEYEHWCKEERYKENKQSYTRIFLSFGIARIKN